MTLYTMIVVNKIITVIFLETLDCVIYIPSILVHMSDVFVGIVVETFICVQWPTSQLS